jgi:hypothetical protein
MVYMSLPRSRQILGSNKCRILIDAGGMRPVRRAYRRMRLQGMSSIEARYMVFNLLDAGRSGKFASGSLPA